MSKGLEAIRQYKQFTCQYCQYHYGNQCNNEDECFSMIIEKELERLEKIDELFEEIGIDENDLPIWFEMQKQDGKKLEALDIIKNKQVNVSAFLVLDNLQEYNDYCDVVGGCKKITQDEYNLLKEVLL